MSIILYIVARPREAPRSFDTLLHDHEQKIRDERHPNMYFDGVGALSIEVSEREVLL